MRNLSGSNKTKSGKTGYVVMICYMSSVSDVDALRRHRSADRADLVVPRTKTVRYGGRSFAVSGPRLWNALPAELKTLNISLLCLKSRPENHVI